MVSETALAHSPIEGIGNFYNGLLHPVFVPAHLLLLLALGLFLGQRGLSAVKSAIGLFALAAIAGLTAAWFYTPPNAEIMLLGLSAIVGLAVAIAPNVTRLPCTVLALLAGGLLGLDSAQEGLSGQDKLIALIGSGVAMCLLLFYPMALAGFVRSKPWQKIGVRIVGSWIAASSLLVLALSLSTQAQT
ncbi:hypothetical protein GCM10022278_20020 [Allohahella marinimesophila]|uniref:HupE / UreJ protein n=2 Tax=Allohahella marinimesophila TaxID=1054972 RepID=A0ABP7P9N9_9GAMM